MFVLSEGSLLNAALDNSIECRRQMVFDSKILHVPTEAYCHKDQADYPEHAYRLLNIASLFYAISR